MRHDEAAALRSDDVDLRHGVFSTTKSRDEHEENELKIGPELSGIRGTGFCHRELLFPRKGFGVHGGGATPGCDTLHDSRGGPRVRIRRNAKLTPGGKAAMIERLKEGRSGGRRRRGARRSFVAAESVSSAHGRGSSIRKREPCLAKKHRVSGLRGSRPAPVVRMVERHVSRP